MTIARRHRCSPLLGRSLAAILLVCVAASGPAAAQAITEIIDLIGDGAGNGLNEPRAIAVDVEGNAYVAGLQSDNAFKIAAPPVINRFRPFPISGWSHWCSRSRPVWSWFDGVHAPAEKPNPDPA